MLQTYIDQVRIYLDDFKTLSLSDIFAASYPNNDNLENLQINRFSILEIINYSSAFFEQLEVEINGGNGKILPYSFNAGEFGQSDILGQLNAFLVSIKSGQYSAVENNLGWLITYQLQNGFYNKSQYKLQPFSVTELKKTQDLIDLDLKSLNNVKLEFAKFLEELENEKKSLVDFKTKKEAELTQISNNLDSTNTNNNTIQTLLNNSTESKTKLDAILAEGQKGIQKLDEIISDMEKSVSKSKTEYGEFLSSLKTTETNYNTLYDEFDSKLKFVESKHDYFTERNIYLDTLIGREVGASLFETFKQRKTELSKPIVFWRLAIGAMTIITVVGIFAIFTNLFGLLKTPTEILSWEIIVVNAIKSSPFIFLLYYTINQYNKERNFQEEYAFKSAVALTIKAYADVLKDDKYKDELILKAVFGIYRSPIYSKIKANKEVNSVLDILKETIDKGVSLVKKESK